MFIIGITGGIGSGKSTVSRMFEDYGITVLNADDISRQVTGPGGSAISEVQSIFGVDILCEDGSMDRKKMAQIVFSDKAKLDQLSLIVHRHVFLEIDRQLKELEKQKVKLAILDIPIPVKEGFIDRSNIILVVDTSDDLRLERLVKRGMKVEDAKRRMALQLSREEYIKLGNFIINNDGEISDLKGQVSRIVDQEIRSRGLLT